MTNLTKASVRLRTLASFTYDAEKIKIPKEYQDVTGLSAYVEFTAPDYITRAVKIYDAFIEQNYENDDQQGNAEIADKIVSMCSQDLSDEDIQKYLNTI